MTLNSDPKNLNEVVGQLAGAVSVCWDRIEKAGVFQSDRASELVDEALEWINKHYVLRQDQ